MQYTRLTLIILSHTCRTLGFCPQGTRMLKTVHSKGWLILRVEWLSRPVCSQTVKRNSIFLSHEIPCCLLPRLASRSSGIFMALSLGLYSQDGTRFSTRDRGCQWEEGFVPVFFLHLKGIVLSSCVHTQDQRLASGRETGNG